MSLLCHDRLRKSRLYVLAVAIIVVAVFVTAITNAQQVQVIPSISVREMYDSNVFYADKSQLPSGTRADDFITTIVPQVNFGQTNSLITTNLSVGAIVQKFARNSNLDNVGFNAAAGIDLSRLANRSLPRMRTARLFGTYIFSPSTPAFGVGGVGAIGAMGGTGIGGAGVGVGGVGIASPLDSGQLAQRMRTSIYNIGASSSYALSPSADFQTTLGYSRLSFGGSYTPTTDSAQAVVFDTTNYNVSAGPTARISAVDTLAFIYTFSQFSQANFGNFSTHNGGLSWGHTWSRAISSSATGGLTLVEPIPALQQGGSNQGRVAATMFPTGGVSITYSSASSLLRSVGNEIQSASPSGGVGVVGGSFLPILAGSTMPGTVAQPGMYSVSMMYNLGVYPSYVSSAGPIYTHILGINGSAGLTDRLTTLAAFNYSHSSFTNQVNSGTFDSYGTILVLNYLVTRTLQTSLTHQWLNFAGGSSETSGAQFSLSKHIIMLSISYAFDPRGKFFRAGAFWDSSTSSSSVKGVEPAQSAPGGVEIKK